MLDKLINGLRTEDAFNLYPFPTKKDSSFTWLAKITVKYGLISKFGKQFQSSTQYLLCHRIARSDDSEILDFHRNFY